MTSAEVSFSAGDLTSNQKHRTINQSTGNRLAQLAKAFPSVKEVFARSPIICIAYPATLGIEGGNGFTVSDTRLFDHHVKKTFALAQRDRRPLVYVAQPLAGAELIHSVLRDESALVPECILWANGGYPMPISLEQHVSALLRKRNSAISYLYSYGTAEVDHTIFAGQKRNLDGEVMYQLVAENVLLQNMPSTTSQPLVMRGPNNKSAVSTGDFIVDRGDYWAIIPAKERLSAKVFNEIESWDDELWSRRTGYLCSENNQTVYQLRLGQHQQNPHELPYFEFCQRIVDAPHDLLKTKPIWGSK